MKRMLIALIVVTGMVLSSARCRANDFSFTGNFSGVNDVQLFTFTLGAGSDVVLRSYSYAGGVNAAGNTIAEGGFDPILALFQGTGPSALMIGQNDDGGSMVPADSVTGNYYDTYLEVAGLAPGIYTASIQEYANFANGPTLGDGFSDKGLDGFAGRDSHWAFDVLGVQSAGTPSDPTATPEPSSLLLLGTGILGVAGAIRRKLVR